MEGAKKYAYAVFELKPQFSKSFYSIHYKPSTYSHQAGELSVDFYAWLEDVRFELAREFPDHGLVLTLAGIKEDAEGIKYFITKYGIDKGNIFIGKSEDEE